MDLKQAKVALEVQEKAFTETVRQPNTLERNVVLATYRTEIWRLQKVIAKAAKH